jgi:hypothetical protein
MHNRDVACILFRARIAESIEAFMEDETAEQASQVVAAMAAAVRNYTRASLFQTHWHCT